MKCLRVKCFKVYTRICRHKTTILTDFNKQKMSEEKNLFIVDDQPDEEDNSEVNESPIPLFSSSKFILGLKDGDDEGSSKISEDEEDYYGKI